MDRVTVKQMNPHIYLMDDQGEATGYLVVGEKKALVIDTMNGYADVHAVARSITDLPLMVVNTHGHCDHIFGNLYFEEAYLNPKDKQIAEEHIHFPEFEKETKARGLSMPPFKEIHGGEQIDLGGLSLEVIALPGHTPGGILLLLKEDRVLFTGDAINRHLWLQLDHSLPLKDCLKELGKVMYLKNEADVILHGHAVDFEPVSLMEELYEGLQALCEGQTQKDSDYPYFGGIARQHPFGREGSVIIYPKG